MKTLIIYTSQTGFTKRYATWLANEVGGLAMPLSQAKEKVCAFFEGFDALVYGGWAMAGKIQKADWFLKRMEGWKGKKLALFMVGASPYLSPDVPVVLEQILDENQKQYARAFYCQGGLNYEKMSLPNKIVMKIFAHVMKKKNPQAGEMVSKSYDIADPRYLEPIIQYLKETK
jgi:menaquinone-dependent protoporphyrinogen IX oxidase